MLLYGGAAGLFAQTVTFPLDVVRRRMQVHGLQTSGAASGAARSALQTLGDLMREAGPRALFRGLSITYLKVAPSTAIGFTLYDSIKRFLDVRGGNL